MMRDVKFNIRGGTRSVFREIIDFEHNTDCDSDFEEISPSGLNLVRFELLTERPCLSLMLRNIRTIVQNLVAVGMLSRMDSSARFMYIDYVESQRMNKSISSGLTFFYKIIFPVIWISGFGFGTLTLFISDSPEKWGFLIALIVGSFFLSFCFGLKAVRIENENLVVSNLLKTMNIPFSNVLKIYENKWVNIRPVTIYFKNRTEFGKEITFMPTAKFLLFSTHPIVIELREKIKE